ncbi:MAG: hypothetical protein UY23_C0001G0379 [Candidatus Jorgensenbacteria bacterium GW2011_GWA1_48_11]|uniref:Integral membrane protein n=1 Tax=Candidatus Jorgensenbacteria bacterium GW2011_GWA1_48_11 TaxID=1618660 RepID=A0A0G1WN44_9BACT|nr:MAG: hypothetical protein UY23_C0001G0379 [Candidatus Jorgensenbacteria bacterium GW2011_GWA1_48_11]KKW12264.1 MAG: hypothetical protein UY51_C0005G0506 [Candidatus Jorgensenbacteria bacterium GW2011_GWB1_49_9]
MNLMWEFLKQTHLGLKAKKRKEQFLIFLSFLVTFIVARFVADLQDSGYLSFLFVGGVHIHHLVFGIFFLIMSGYLAISYSHKEDFKSFTAVLFGIGAALTVDEFTLWLFLDNNYWDRVGRYNVDAMIVLAGVFFIIYLLGEAHDWKLSKKIKSGV